MRVDAVMPVLNEEENLPGLLAALPSGLLRRVVVVDNGSTDRSAELARAHGCVVVAEPRRGYGRAVLTGLAHLAADPPDAVLFLDGDGANDPAEIPLLLAPLADGSADLVVGTRLLGTTERGAMPPQAFLGNHLTAFLIRRLYGATTTDIGPFRAATWPALRALALADEGMGLTTEMVVKALRQGLVVREVPVSCRPRRGRSKISGTVRGTVRAGAKILFTVARHAPLTERILRRAQRLK